MTEVKKRPVVALGFFDGVHLGHGALLRCARKRADALGTQALALSFDALPRAILGGEEAPLLSTMEGRKRLMQRFYRMDDVVFVHFDRDVMQMPWEKYVETYILGRLKACHVVCGDDHRFGYKGQGTPEGLKAFCEARGLGCDIIPEVDLDGVRVSSTAIRRRLLEGDLPAARRFLGHPHLMGGEVVHGDHRGRTLGVPTANILIPDGVLTPPFGVYCARAERKGVLYPAVVNIGVHPTAGDAPQAQMEAWIYGLNEDLYGQHLDLWLYEMLRREQKFDSLEALRQQIFRDAQQTRAYFGI